MSSQQLKTGIAEHLTPAALPSRAKVSALFRDRRWHDVGPQDGFADCVLRLPNDTRLIVWQESESAYNVGALQGDRAVWDHLQNASAQEVEQAAFDCWTALSLLESVRAVPTESGVSARTRRKVRRCIARAVVRHLLQWALVFLGAVLGAALCALWALLGFLLGYGVVR